MAGLALLINANATAEDTFLRRTVLATLGVSAFLEFYVNAVVLPLPIELALQPGVGR